VLSWAADGPAVVNCPGYKSGFTNGCITPELPPKDYPCPANPSGFTGKCVGQEDILQYCYSHPTTDVMICGIAITSLNDLKKIGNDLRYPLSGHYVLANDIDVSVSKAGEREVENEWIPIGAWQRQELDASIKNCPNRNCSEFLEPIFNGGFSGFFDGNGYTIKGLYHNVKNQAIHAAVPSVEIRSVGLFGALNGATVRNLTIELDTLTAWTPYSPSVYLGVFGGAVAGISRNSTIENSRVKGALSGFVFTHGRQECCPCMYGLARHAVPCDCMLGICSHGGPVIDLNLGGFVGRSIATTISGSASTVTIDASVRAWSQSANITIETGRIGRVGGFVGVSDGSTISGSNSTVKIDGHGAFAGGFIGENIGGEVTASSGGVTWAASPDFANIEMAGIDQQGSSVKGHAKAGALNTRAPMVTVRGKMLNVKTPSAANLQISLVDMRGRTVMRFNTAGSGSFSLSNVPAGRYFVDIKDMKGKKDAKRFTSSIVVR